MSGGQGDVGRGGSAEVPEAQSHIGAAGQKETRAIDASGVHGPHAVADLRTTQRRRARRPQNHFPMIRLQIPYGDLIVALHGRDDPRMLRRMRDHLSHSGALKREQRF